LLLGVKGGEELGRAKKGKLNKIVRTCARNSLGRLKGNVAIYLQETFKCHKGGLKDSEAFQGKSKTSGVAGQ